MSNHLDRIGRTITRSRETTNDAPPRTSTSSTSIDSDVETGGISLGDVIQGVFDAAVEKAGPFAKRVTRQVGTLVDHFVDLYHEREHAHEDARYERIKGSPLPGPSVTMQILQIALDDDSRDNPTETATTSQPGATRPGDAGDGFRGGGNDNHGTNGGKGATRSGDYGDGLRGPGSSRGTGRSRSNGGSEGGGNNGGSQRGGNEGASRGGDAGDGLRGPIVMDLDGDGVELVALDESAAFYDINADGYQYNMGWAGADDGLLAFDKDGDNDITARDEIAFIDYVDGARTDWEGLVHFDSNNDGVLDNRDAEFAKFRVWQDADGDGDVDAGELKTLAQHSIRSLDLNPNYGAALSPTDRDGNLIYGEGDYTKTDGTRGVFGDVALATGAMGYRVNNGQLEFKSADGVGKVYVAPANAGGVNMNFASSVNAAHIGAIGGSHADVLNGGGVSRDLLLFGDEGNDRLTGGSGDDWLAGGAGADILRGGNGNDVLFFDARDDVHGGGGQDVGVVSGSGAINLSMGAVGLEALHSGDGNDRLSGADSAQGVIIDGGGGADTMRGSHHRDVLSGGAGNDHIKGKPGDDVILGGAGDDDLFGNFGDDVLFGGEGDDYLNGLVGDDALYGGAGSDTYDFGYPNVPMGVLPDFGRETVRDSGGANDKVTFGRRRHEDLWLAKDGDDLRISILGGDDEVLIEDQFAAGGEHRIETLQAATRLYSYGRYSAQTVSIDALVNAMAGFDKPQAGWSHMTTQQRADVHAAWRSVGIAPTVGG